MYVFFGFWYLEVQRIKIRKENNRYVHRVSSMEIQKGKTDLWIFWALIFFPNSRTRVVSILSFQHFFFVFYTIFFFFTKTVVEIPGDFSKVQNNMKFRVTFLKINSKNLSRQDQNSAYSLKFRQTM